VAIYLPRHHVAERLMPEPKLAMVREPPAKDTGAIVLVVEDEPNIRSVIVELLENCGFTVLVADGRVSALRIVNFAGRIDLLVSDIGLPADIDGLDLASTARQHRPDLKVLFVTSHSNYSEVDGRLWTGDVEVLIRPFTLDNLARKVQSMVFAR